jgi:hypothetical protein
VNPGGEKAVDGNIATAWHAMKGGVLTLDHPGTVPVRSISLMNSCPNSSGSKVEAIEILGSDNQAPWREEFNHLEDTAYFQTLRLPVMRRTSRLNVRILSAAGRRPTCIAELRVNTSD